MFPHNIISVQCMLFLFHVILFLLPFPCILSVELGFRCFLFYNFVLLVFLFCFISNCKFVILVDCPFVNSLKMRNKTIWEFDKGIWTLLFYIGRKRYQVTLTSYFIFLINHLIPLNHTTVSFASIAIEWILKIKYWFRRTSNGSRDKQDEPL